MAKSAAVRPFHADRAAARRLPCRPRRERPAAEALRRRERAMGAGARATDCGPIGGCVATPQRRNRLHDPHAARSGSCHGRDVTARPLAQGQRRGHSGAAVPAPGSPRRATAAGPTAMSPPPSSRALRQSPPRRRPTRRSHTWPSVGSRRCACRRGAGSSRRVRGASVGGPLLRCASLWGQREDPTLGQVWDLRCGPRGDGRPVRERCASRGQQ